MTITLYIILLIVFLVFNFIFIRKMKNFTIDRNNIKLFHSLFFITMLVRYLLNYRFYNRRFEIFTEEVSYSGGALGGVNHLVELLIIYPYLLVLLYTLFISSVLILFNRSFKMGSLNFYSDWSRPLKITIVAAFILLWVTLFLNDIY